MTKAFICPIPGTAFGPPGPLSPGEGAIRPSGGIAWILEPSMTGCEGVFADPAPESRIAELGDFAVLLKLHAWTNPAQAHGGAGPD